eukprot:675340-Prymnesium_polylepis.1
MRALYDFGWRRLRGSSSCCALVMPLGFMLATLPPQRSESGEVWTANTSVLHLLRQHRLYDIGLTYAIAQTVSYSAFSALGITRIFNGGAIDRTELIADGCRRFAVYVIVSLVFVWAMAQDHRLLRRTPFPILSFSSLRWNWLGALAMI